MTEAKPEAAMASVRIEAKLDKLLHVQESQQRQLEVQQHQVVGTRAGLSLPTHANGRISANAARPDFSLSVGTQLA